MSILGVIYPEVQLLKTIDPGLFRIYNRGRVYDFKPQAFEQVF